jgi:hypothetical protein
MEATKQKIIGILIALGLVITVCSGALVWVFSVSGIYRGTYTRKPITNEITDAGALNWVPIMIVFLVMGLVIIAGAILYGFATVVKERQGARQVLPNFHVIARYCIDKGGQMLTDPYDIELAERPRFYVRAVAPQKEIVEYETSFEMFTQAGEGMTGEAEIQGKWIGRFTPYIGLPPQS